MLTPRLRMLSAGATTGLVSLAAFCGCRGTTTGPAANNPVAVDLVAAAESSVAVVPSAVIGTATKFSVFLRDRLGQEFVSEDEVITARIVGVNGGPDSSIALSYVNGSEYSATQVPTVKGLDTVTILLDGEEVGGRPFFRLVTEPDVAEPVYDANNPDHLLHVYEDWSNHQTVGDLGSARRADGGPPWQDAGITRYGAVVDSADPYGSVRYVTTEYVSDPPIPPHGTGPHAEGYHWATAGTLSDFQGDDNAVGGSKNNRSFKLSGATAYLNKPAKAAVVYEWAVRERGPNNWFEGKSVDINAGLSTGVGRFNWNPWDVDLGSSADCSDPLCELYYDDNGRTPRMAGLPPTSNYVAPNISRLHGSMPTVRYKQNLAWGLGAGDFSWGRGGVMNAEPNADFRGVGAPMWKAGWLYNKLRITKQAPGAGFGYGRIEMWIGATPGQLVKVIEYLGDVGALAEGQVFIDPTGDSDQLAGPINFYELASRRFTGGAVVDIGTIRIWSHSRQ